MLKVLDAKSLACSSVRGTIASAGTGRGLGRRRRGRGLGSSSASKSVGKGRGGRWVVSSVNPGPKRERRSNSKSVLGENETRGTAESECDVSLRSMGVRLGAGVVETRAGLLSCSPDCFKSDASDSSDGESSPKGDNPKPNGRRKGEDTQRK